MNTNFRVIFLGTPDFAVESLKHLVEAGLNIVAVVTAPDKPAGRGMLIQQSPVKKYALSQNIPVLQPERLKSVDFISTLKSFDADLQIVIAFRMLPEVVWNMPRLGTINLHASLLPDYRGAAPINWAVINGEKVTGVSTFLLKHEIDTGDIIDKREVNIGATTTAGELHDELMKIGAEVILASVRKIESGNYSPIPQANTSTKVAPKIFTPQCRINWQKTGLEVFNQIRGLSPYPGAFTHIGERIFKIYACNFIQASHSAEIQPGRIFVSKEKPMFIRFAVVDGWIEATDVQLQGKKRMNADELLKGWRMDD
jgi:methionyl-tRNA formyltransferase